MGDLYSVGQVKRVHVSISNIIHYFVTAESDDRAAQIVLTKLHSRA